ncbi:hypothetical protein N7513_001742 [Penicillium frequentans]|nr:hypothetical protein N7513_001742 [Penicillium glabrum]
MKSYWRQKKNERQRQEDFKFDQPALRPLLSSKPRDENEPVLSTESQPTNEPPLDHQISSSNQSTQTSGIPVQLFDGLRFVFASALGQRTETNPYQIFAHHHQFFYHWLEARAFTPFRDIWIPLDLSNPASFNGILAHAAADIVGSRGDGSSSEILKYKTEAIEIINKWLGTTATTIKDEVFAGVVRLLTFERYWGTRERFELHRFGLQQMVKARGGYQAFGLNWRLQLVLSLLTMVEVPEQPPSVGYLMEEFENLVYEILGLFYLPHGVSKQFRDLERLRSFRSLAEAIELLQHDKTSEEVMYGDALPEWEAASKCLQLLLFIWATFQDSGKRNAEHLKEDDDILYALDGFLRSSRDIWANSDSENKIFWLILEDFAKREENEQITLFVTIVTESLREISPRALRGVEQCLLSYWNEKRV